MGYIMKDLQPISIESMRRFIVLLFLVVFAWVYFYTPSDIYEIQVKNYDLKYEQKVKKGLINPSETSLDSYVAFKMKGAYTWSSRKYNIVEIKDEPGTFLNRILSINRSESSDLLINKHRSPDTFWFGNSYFFRSSDLPENFLLQTFLKHPDYLFTIDANGQKNYFQLYKVNSTSKLNSAPVWVAYPLRIYAYFLLVLTLFVYLILPKPKLPQGAAYYTRFNAVYLADTLGFFLWIAAWIAFFAHDDSSMYFGQYILFFFFAPFALAIILPTIKYASNWYLFREDSFEFSDKDGIGKVSLQDIVSIKPYKRELPKWIAPLMILFGRGNPVATGTGMISMSASPEIGMEITLKSGNKIKVMANYLEADEVFTQRFKELEKKLA